MNFEVRIKAELEESRQVLDRFVADQSCLQSVSDAAQCMGEAILAGGKVFSCGNGVSLCDAMHFAEELTGRYRDDRRALPAIAISDPSYLTCVANDLGFEYVFSRYLEGQAQKGDVLLALSTSGNSPNILQAVETARRIGMKSILLTGHDGGALKSKADHEIIVPHSGYADRIQEVHIKIIHILILLIEQFTANQE